MSGDQGAAPAAGGLRLPGNAHEFTALALSVLSVFAVVQVGAPIIRTMDFLDETLRNYFIGISFVAFPAIHRGFKRGIALVAPQSQPPRAQRDPAPWYVTGVLTAAVLFAWNQFASLLGGLSVGTMLASLGLKLDPMQVANAATYSILAVSLPLSAVASIFAGIAANRYTRAHPFRALAFAALAYLAFNVGFTLILLPEYFWQQVNGALANGPEGLVYFGIGLSLVAAVVFVFGMLGVAISRLKGESSIGRLIEAARGMTPVEREALWAEIARRRETGIRET